MKRGVNRRWRPKKYVEADALPLHIKRLSGTLSLVETDKVSDLVVNTETIILAPRELLLPHPNRWNKAALPEPNYIPLCPAASVLLGSNIPSHAPLHVKRLTMKNVNARFCPYPRPKVIQPDRSHG